MQLLANEVAKLPAKNAPLGEGDICTCALPATHGLPCCHTLYKHLTGDGPVELKQIHRHWWNYRPVTDEEEQQVVNVMSDIPLEPVKVKGKGRPAGAIASVPASKKKGEGIAGTKRLPSAFEYELEDERAMAVPPSTAPPVMERAPAGKPRGRPRKQQLRGRHRKQQPQQLQLQAQRQAQEADCIVVAVMSEGGGHSESWVTTTKLGLRRLQEAGEDAYEPGTVPPRAHQRSIDALDAVNPEVEDAHDALLADGEAEARLAHEDAAALQGGDEDEEQGTTIEG